MRRFIGLSVVFILCFLLDICIPQSSLAMPTCGFAPFVTTMLGRSSRHKTLLLAFLCGIVHDLFTMQHRIGVSATGYVFCTLCCFLLQRRYFEEKAVPFFFVTYLLSCLFSLFFIFFGFAKGLVIHVSLKMLKHQLIYNPFFDASIGLIGVFIPLKVYAAIKKRILKRSHAL